MSISKAAGDAILLAIAKRRSLIDLAAYEASLWDHPHHTYTPDQKARLQAAIDARRAELMKAAEITDPI